MRTASANLAPGTWPTRRSEVGRGTSFAENRRGCFRLCGGSSPYRHQPRGLHLEFRGGLLHRGGLVRRLDCAKPDGFAGDRARPGIERGERFRVSSGNTRDGVARVISTLFFHVDNNIEIDICTGRKRC